MRYYDLCVIVREAQAEMKLLNEQYKDLADDAHNEDALEWLLSEKDRPAIKEWEQANPKWKVTGNGIRAQKQNDSSAGDGERKTLNTRQATFEPLPASYLLGLGGDFGKGGHRRMENHGHATPNARLSFL